MITQRNCPPVNESAAIKTFKSHKLPVSPTPFSFSQRILLIIQIYT